MRKYCVRVLVLSIGVSKIMSELIESNCPSVHSNGTFDLENFLPPTYSRHKVPIENGRPVTVLVDVVVKSLGNINPESMTYDMNLFLELVWRDYRFCPIPKERLKSALDDDWHTALWKPDIYIENALDGKVLQTFSGNIYTFIYPNNTISFDVKLSLRLSCEMEFYNYPHDTQICEIVLMSYAYSLSEVDLQWAEGIRFSHTVVLSQFDIAQTETFSKIHTKGSGKMVRELEAKIHLKRRQGYFFIHNFIPTILIVLMSMVSFWIPPEAAPARVALPVTSLLTLSTKSASMSISSVSYIMAIDIWMLGCLGFVFFTLIEYAFVTTALQKEKAKQASPKISYTNAVNRLNKVLPLTRQDPKGSLASFEIIRAGYKNPIHLQRPALHPSLHPTESSKPLSKKIDSFAAFIFPFLFLIQIITYYVYFILYRN